MSNGARATVPYPVDLSPNKPRLQRNAGFIPQWIDVPVCLARLCFLFTAENPSHASLAGFIVESRSQDAVVGAMLVEPSSSVWRFDGGHVRSRSLAAKVLNLVRIE